MSEDDFSDEDAADAEARPAKILYAPGDSVIVGISEHGFPSIAYRPHPDYGAQEGLLLGLEFSIEQARGIAQALLRKADEAEQRGRQGSN
jgi:hypothetical protein